MTSPARTIFRPSTLKRYREGRERATLPRYPGLPSLGAWLGAALGWLAILAHWIRLVLTRPPFAGSTSTCRASWERGHPFAALRAGSGRPGGAYRGGQNGRAPSVILSYSPHSVRWHIGAALAMPGLIGGLPARLLNAARAFRRGRRVPVVLQMAVSECGAACLAMILEYHGRRATLDECRDALGIGRDGVTARQILEAGRQFGLRVKAYSLEPDDWLHVPLPAIAHWRFDHFVVVERWSRGDIEIVDPAAGRRRLTAAEVDEAFTGVVLTLTPGADFVRVDGRDRPTWATTLARLARADGVPRLMVQIVVAAVVLQVVGLATPLASKLLIDDVLGAGRHGLLGLAGLAVGVVVATLVATSYLRGLLLVHLQARLDAELTMGFCEHLLQLPLRFFQRRTSGDLLMRLNSSLLLRDALASQILPALLDTALVLAYLAILLSQDLLTFGLTAGLALLQVAVLVVSSSRVRSLTERHLAADSQVQAYLVEVLGGIQTLKAAGAETRAFDHWSNLYQHQLTLSAQRGQVTAGVDALLAGVRLLGPLVLLWIGVVQVLDGALSLGAMLALNALAIGCLAPLGSLVGCAQSLQTLGAHLTRIADAMEAEREQHRRRVRPAPELRGRIELDRVSFRYDVHAPPVLRDVSLTIEPGQKVAIVGRSGSGKSTLGLLLLGLYEPTAGSVRYDGVPLAELEYRSVRRQIGVALQEGALFAGTIRQNIAFGEPSLSLDEIEEAARQAAIDEEIERLPMGYETILAERGDGLSGGQRQRLAIARALARRPAILLLDEATSHLDVAAERLVDENLSRLRCTRVVIAHRLSTVRNADLIVVLDGGQIVEQGTHETLLAQDGVYARLTATSSELRVTSDEKVPTRNSLLTTRNSLRSVDLGTAPTSAT